MHQFLISLIAPAVEVLRRKQTARQGEVIPRLDNPLHSDGAAFEIAHHHGLHTYQRIFARSYISVVPALDRLNQLPASVVHLRHQVTAVVAREMHATLRIGAEFLNLRI